MIRYCRDAYVEVSPFTRQAEGEEVVIGRPGGGEYFALPGEAVEILDALAAGRSVGEVQDAFEAEHGIVPDMEDLLGFLESQSLVRLRGEAGELPAVPATVAESAGPTWLRALSRFESLGRWLFSPLALVLYALLAAAALAAVFLDPALAPRRSSLFFSRHSGPMLLAVAALSYVGVFFHEMGHVLAARAAGVPARLGIGNRLWVVVIEADLTALWSLPKRKRYLPLIAGPLVDVAFWSIVTLTLFGQQRGWLHLPLTATLLLKAMLFVYLMALSWQLFFFVRTDVYYGIATFFGCKNLLGDTESYLRNLLARLLGRPEPVDLSAVPRSEQRVIRGYAAFWLLGRLAAFLFLFLVTLPLAKQYLQAMSMTFSIAHSWRDSNVVDAAIGTALVIVPLSVGFWLWIQGFTRNWRRAR